MQTPAWSCRWFTAWMPALLIAITDRSAVQNIGLLAREQDSLPVLTSELKHALQFQGSIMAGVTDGRFLPPFVKDVDLLLYTPDCATLVERALPDAKRMLIEYQISANTSEIIRGGQKHLGKLTATTLHPAVHSAGPGTVTPHRHLLAIVHPSPEPAGSRPQQRYRPAHPSNPR